MLQVAIIQFNLDSIRESCSCAPCFRAFLSRAFARKTSSRDFSFVIRFFFCAGVCRRIVREGKRLLFRVYQGENPF